MASLPPAEAAAGLLALQRQFQAGLARRADELQDAASQPAQVHALLHRLVGAAGAYGDQALASQARALMQALSPAGAGASLQDEQQLLLQALCTHCRQRARAIETCGVSSSARGGQGTSSSAQASL